jgi:hypothetical protein
MYDWYTDSGATVLMTMKHDWMQNFSTLDKCMEVTVANGEKLSCLYSGNVPVHTNRNGANTIQDAMFVPEHSINLLSVNKMAEKEMIIISSNVGCQIYHQSDCRIEGKVEATPINVGGMYQLNEEKSEMHPMNSGIVG